MLGTKILEERESKFNGHLRVVRSFGLGTYIQADGLTQSGGIVESIWKQTLKKVKGKGQGVKNCLILGLGGGTVAKLIRKTWPHARIVGVDIDPVMIELGKRYLGLDQIGVNIKIGDAKNFLDSLIPIRDRNGFNLIIIDLYNGDQFPEKFATENYIQLARTVLASDGVAIFNRLYYGDKRSQAVRFGLKLEKIFPKVKWFYPEANLIYICTT